MYHKNRKKPIVENKKTHKKDSPNKEYAMEPLLRPRFQLQKTLGNQKVRELYEQQKILTKLYVNKPWDE